MTTSINNTTIGNSSKEDSSVGLPFTVQVSKNFLVKNIDFEIDKDNISKYVFPE